MEGTGSDVAHGDVVPNGVCRGAPASRRERGAGHRCDGARASTPHQAMQIVLGDASVRSLSASLSADTWWKLCQPGDGAVINLDQ